MSTEMALMTETLKICVETANRLEPELGLRVLDFWAPRDYYSAAADPRHKSIFLEVVQENKVLIRHQWYFEAGAENQVNDQDYAEYVERLAQMTMIDMAALWLHGLHGHQDRMEAAIRFNEQMNAGSSIPQQTLTYVDQRVPPKQGDRIAVVHNPESVNIGLVNRTKDAG